MITYVNDLNARQYRILYAKATADLMNHDSTGALITPDQLSTAAWGIDAIKAIPWDGFGAEGEGKPVYEQYSYYVWKVDKTLPQIEGHYELSSDEVPKEETGTYYLAPDITSLNQYFNKIEELAHIDKIYTKLPLDEETFDINANTREIKVPTHFAQNGISVLGDEIAEVIYFKINRYFDIIDLATKNIYIQWISAATDEKTGTLMEGLSVPWCIDLVSEPNYIIFGWPISSKITKEAGQISFAVRFYSFDSDVNEITYSFSTLTQTVTVKPALDFDIRSSILAEQDLAETLLHLDNNEALILSRLVDSDLQEGATKAEVPYFIVNLDPEEAGAHTENGVQVTEAWLGLDGEGFRTRPIEAIVQATSDDAGRISYVWKKYNIKTTDDIPENTLMALNYSYKYLDTEDTERNPIKTYYTRTSNSMEDNVFIEYKGDVFDIGDENYPEFGIFERFSKATLDEVGKYSVVVTNRAGNSTEKASSYLLYIKEPVVPEIETPLPERAYLLVDANDSENNYKTTLTVGVTSTDQEKSKFTYQWLIQTPGSSEWEDINGATEASYTIEGTNAKYSGENAIGKVGDGLYRVLVNNNLNKETKQIESSIVRVTHAAGAPTITIAGRTTFNLAEAAESGLTVLGEVNADRSEVRDDTDGDGVLYQWYKYHTGSGKITQDDVTASNNGTYDIDGDEPLPGETSPTYYPSAVGHYFCKVTNKYNNVADVYTLSRFFIVTDSE